MEHIWISPPRWLEGLWSPKLCPTPWLERDAPSFQKRRCVHPKLGITCWTWIFWNLNFQLLHELQIFQIASGKQQNRKYMSRPSRPCHKIPRINWAATKKHSSRFLFSVDHVFFRHVLPSWTYQSCGQWNCPKQKHQTVCVQFLWPPSTACHVFFSGPTYGFNLQFNKKGPTMSGRLSCRWSAPWDKLGPRAHGSQLIQALEPESGHQRGHQRWDQLKVPIFTDQTTKDHHQLTVN